MKLNVLILLCFLSFSALAQDNVPGSIYDFKVAAQNGGTIDFSQFRGKKILIVNTPSDADNNPMYAELDAMYKKYQGKLVIIGFLDEDFGVPPGSKKGPAIANKTYSVSFPLAAKVLVRGDAMAPIYKWLTQQKYNNFKDTEVKWDFQKYLINENGKLVAVFDPKIRPANTNLVSAVEN